MRGYHFPIAKFLRTAVFGVFAVLAGLPIARAADNATPLCKDLEPTNFECRAPDCLEAQYVGAGGEKAKWIALVLGNDAYKGEHSTIVRLRNGSADAAGVAKKLEEQDFSVRCLLNASSAQVEKEITSLRNHFRALTLAQVKREDVRGVVYYAGHGASIGEESYMILSGDFPTRLTKGQLTARSISVSKLRRDITSYAIAHPIIILDACRSRISLSNDDRGEKKLDALRAPSEKIEPPDNGPQGDFLPGYALVFATTNNDSASDIGPRFTPLLIEEIDSWGRDLDSIIGAARDELQRKTGSGQLADYRPATPMTRKLWRQSKDEECDIRQHGIAQRVLLGCPGPWQSCANEFKIAAYKNIICKNWNSYADGASDSCWNDRLRPYWRYFEECRNEPNFRVASDGRPIGSITSSGTPVVTSNALASLKMALATNRLDAFVEDASQPGYVPVSTGMQQLDQWGDLLVRPKTGAMAVPMGPNISSIPQAPIVLQPEAVLVPLGARPERTDTEVAVPKFEGGHDKAGVARPSAGDLTVRVQQPGNDSLLARIPIDDVLPRQADDVVVLNYATGADAADEPAKEDLKTLETLATKYNAIPGARVIVTGGYSKGGAGAATDENGNVKASRSQLVAIGRSLKIGNSVISKGLDAKSVRAGDTVEILNNSSEEIAKMISDFVAVEFYGAIPNVSSP